VFGRGEDYFREKQFFHFTLFGKKRRGKLFSGENDFPPYEGNYFPLKSYVS